MNDLSLTEKETALFKELCADAGDWNGSPLWNQDGSKTKADNAVLGSLVKKKLVTTMEDEVHDLGARGRRKGSFKKNIIQYVSFTEEGVKLAVSFGFEREQLIAG